MRASLFAAALVACAAPHTVAEPPPPPRPPPPPEERHEPAKPACVVALVDRQMTLRDRRFAYDSAAILPDQPTCCWLASLARVLRDDPTLKRVAIAKCP